MGDTPSNNHGDLCNKKMGNDLGNDEVSNQNKMREKWGKLTHCTKGNDRVHMHQKRKHGIFHAFVGLSRSLEGVALKAIAEQR